MRSLFSRLLFAGLLGLAAGCTPSASFCPNIGADAGGVCPILGDDAMVPFQDTGMSQGCPNGYIDNPDGNGTLICKP